MSISSFIAIRYLSSNRKNLFFSWISILSICGIAIGVATMIVVLSVIDGFQAELRNRFLNANAHVLAYRFPAGMKDPQSWADTIKRDFTTEIEAFSLVEKEGLMMADYFSEGLINQFPQSC